MIACWFGVEPVKKGSLTRVAVGAAGGGQTREDRNGAGLRQDPPPPGGYSVTHRSTHTVRETEQS